MVLCECCRALPAELFDRSGGSVCKVLHQSSYHSLEASATQGCELCVLLLDAIHRYFLGDVSSITKEPQKEAFSLRSDTAGQYLEIGRLVVGVMDGRIVPDGFENKNKGCDRDNELETIHSWLNICQNQHGPCKKLSTTPYVPTRLVKVDLENKDQVQLVQIKNEKVTDKRYLALSHCWGINMPQSALTKVATLPRRLRRINVSDLPLTFRDAINIARQLGVPYVWIDSLCIVQDSNEDWEREAADMTSVYSEAYLTIAATSSTNSSEGCRTYPDSIPTGPVILECLNLGWDIHPAPKAVRVFPMDRYQYNFRSQPLHARGWTLQERELSPRVIFYTKETIRWECSCLKASLRFPWDDSTSFYTEIFNRGNTRWRTAYSGTGPKDTKEMEIIWHLMACKFMDRKLTFQSDVLPAISGMARLVQQFTGDLYLAGLWKSSLLRGLLWESNWDTNYATVRSTEYLAPSWSWASLVGPIHYHELDDITDVLVYSDIGPLLRPRILEAGTQPAGLDPFGRVKSGFIRLECTLKMAQVRGPKRDIFNVGLEVWHDDKKVGDLVYDVFTDLPKEDTFEVACLYFRPKNKSGRPHPTGIALRIDPESGEGVYVRVGLLFCIEEAFFAKSERTIITII